MPFEIDADRLQEAIGRFAQARVLVLGDVMLDQFIWGSVRRISPEAPVPVVEVDSETYMLGGAANVVHNLIALGGRAALCGLVGDDIPGRQVAELLDDLEVPSEGIVVSTGRPTTVKTRVVAHSQQVVRVDRENRQTTQAGEIERMLDYLAREIPLCQAVIVSDYAKGVVSAQVLEAVKDLAREHGLIVTVDPKVANMPLYAGATVITPNHHEALDAARLSGDGADAVLAAGRKLRSELQARCVLVTQGERGMTLFSADGESHIPTLAKRVFDVTGAGDTVISTLTMGLVAGLEPVEAAALANIAAGVVVGEVGTSAVTGGRLSQAVQEGVPALKRMIQGS